MTSSPYQSYDRPTRNGLNTVLKFVFLAALCALTYQSIAPFSGSPTVAHFDKIQHAGAYGILAALLGLGWPRLSLLWIICLPSAYGVGLEIAQALTPYGRTGSIYDGIANAAGACLAVGLWVLYVKIKNK